MDAKTEQKTVLIVEDEKNIVDILRFNLQREGYRTLEAYDGADGLDKARKENPDIILLDVMLPKMIGFDVCRALREEGNNVPVIILTAREEEADKVLGLEIGADDYITKPFSMRELIARVKANIRRTGMNAAVVRRRRGRRHAGGGESVHQHRQPPGVPGRQAHGPYHPGIRAADLSGQPSQQGLFPDRPDGAGVELRLCRRRPADGGRHCPASAGENRGGSRQSQIHPHPPGCGILFRGVSRAFF